MFNKYFITVLFVVVLCIQSIAQRCTISLKGIITDESTKVPLEYANVLITENQKGNTTDAKGLFTIADLCPGSYHIQISHLGCEGQQLFIELTKDTTLSISLHHHTELLNEIAIHSTHEQRTVQAVQSIAKEDIIKNANKNLSDILESINGVRILKNGSGISKPVIHGLYGNRITILNNGITQAGQQWGNDHAPEIDPFMSDHISVVKGSASLAYGGNGLGSIVMIEAGAIDEDPHMHGLVNYIFQQNGKAHTLNARLQKYSDQLAWKLNGTFKKSGDTRSPDYFLTNTGKSEYNLGTLLSKKWNSKWSSTAYLSTFNTELGILRGSHIGNISDLEDAFNRTIPFFTKDTFSYRINAPKQRINHHLAKFESKYEVSHDLILTFVAASQLNNRKEYDVRRSGRSDVPALSLRQWLHSAEARIHKAYTDELHIKSGLQLNIIDNTNIAETGILPLIPDYISYRPGTYFIVEKNTSKYTIEGGLRSDWNNMQVVSITRSLPLSIERSKHNFLNLNIAGGIKYTINENSHLSFNTGISTRAPEINELYSNGLHQGVSGIEEGSRSLQKEKSIKSIVGFDSKFKNSFFVQTYVYHQYIHDYIYLQPQKELRLTIRGAFPVYTYSQTNASISGLDFLSSYTFSDHLKWVGKYAYIYGKDRSNKTGLLFMPPNVMNHEIEWTLNNSHRFRNNSVTVSGKHVFRQTNVNEEQDFLSPPQGYTVFGIAGNTDIIIGHNQLKLSIHLENILDTSYRDYLNRLRYFADELGRQVSIRASYVF